MLSAAHLGVPEADAALERLCRTYWFPVYAYVRRRGYAVEDAKDLTQGFFTRLLANGALTGADPAKGKFRSFLIVALNHFLANEWDRSNRLKRGSGQPLLSLDDTAENRYNLEPVTNLTPDKLYERHWALTLLDQALARLRQEFEASGQMRQFGLLQPFLANEPETGDYANVAHELTLTTGAVAVAVHRFRNRYRELVKEEIAHTVSDAADVDDELRSLFAALT